jgi:hypothetical protein
LGSFCRINGFSPTKGHLACDASVSGLNDTHFFSGFLQSEFSASNFEGCVMRVMFWISVLSLVGGLLSTPVLADEGKVSSLLYSCNLSFHASGKSIYVGIGYTDIEGKGTLSCYDFLTGATQHIPLKVSARGPGAGLGVTGLALSGGATGVGISKGPESLLGHYVALRGNAAVGVGVGAATALRLSNGSATIDVSLQAQNGLGAGVDLLWVDLQADGEKTVESSAVTAVAPAAPVAPLSAPIAAPAPQSAAAPVAPAVAAAPTVTTVTVPAKVLYVKENQPVHLVDSQGRLLQVLYLRKTN